MEKIEINNIENDQIVSQILATVGSLAEDRKYECEIIKESNQGEKCNIITTIIINISSSVIYDLLKYAINRYRESKNYNGNVNITVNGKKMTIEELKKYLEDK